MWMITFLLKKNVDLHLPLDPRWGVHPTHTIYNKLDCATLINAEKKYHRKYEMICWVEDIPIHVFVCIALGCRLEKFRKDDTVTAMLGRWRSANQEDGAKNKDLTFKETTRSIHIQHIQTSQPGCIEHGVQ